jgi:hypothetical protein
MRIHIQRPLKDTPRAPKLLIVEFELRIARPVIDALAIPPDVVFELLALSSLVLVQFLQVGEALGRRHELLILAVDGLPEELLGADLYRGCGLVFYAWWAAGGLHGCGWEGVWVWQGWVLWLR